MHISECFPRRNTYSVFLCQEQFRNPICGWADRTCIIFGWNAYHGCWFVGGKCLRHIASHLSTWRGKCWSQVSFTVCQVHIIQLVVHITKVQVNSGVEEPNGHSRSTVALCINFTNNSNRATWHCSPICSYLRSWKQFYSCLTEWFFNPFFLYRYWSKFEMHWSWESFGFLRVHFYHKGRNHFRWCRKKPTKERLDFYYRKCH